MYATCNYQIKRNKRPIYDILYKQKVPTLIKSFNYIFAIFYVNIVQQQNTNEHTQSWKHMKKGRLVMSTICEMIT